VVEGLKFWKMHGTGNDFIVIDNRDLKINENEIADFAKRVCERRWSVGGDGLILVYASDVADFKMRMFNPDGNEAEICGNGIRCFVKFCYDNAITRKRELKIETLAGIKYTWLSVNKEVKSVKVDMGTPSFERRSLPMFGEGKCIGEKLEVDGEIFEITCLSIGNPHCVVFVEDLEAFPVQESGPKIETHKVFPRYTNVEFVQVVNRGEIKVRVWERGVGETLACGTGACASAVASQTLGKTDKEVAVHLLGGNLKILYDGDIFMSGPAVKVFMGQLFSW
jgi:diaminopimelate epimerase